MPTKTYEKIRTRKDGTVHISYYTKEIKGIGRGNHPRAKTGCKQRLREYILEMSNDECHKMCEFYKQLKAQEAGSTSENQSDK